MYERTELVLHYYCLFHHKTTLNDEELAALWTKTCVELEMFYLLAYLR
jgi:hypothetical protein